jgi:tRNA threonylcarbamoyl adenosine modification protein (Sua5/YciO/YrdC/YwlC family)
MLIKIYPENPSEKQLQIVVDVLRNGGVVIIPTDSVYAFVCDINKARAIERIARLKGIKPEKADFSFLFYDLSNISEYVKQISNEAFKMIRKNLPGPFTFILHANNKIPKIFHNSKKTLGVRVPNNSIPREIVRLLGNPILSSSVHDYDEILEYTTDPSLIHERYENQIDLVVDGGFGNNEASAVIDCTGDTIEIIRNGFLEPTF